MNTLKFSHVERQDRENGIDKKHRGIDAKAEFGFLGIALEEAIL